MPNAFAYFALLSWPLVAVILFRMLPVQKALIATLVGGYLILPTATHVKLPMLPTMDKALVPALSALLLCWIYAPRVMLAPNWVGRSGRMVIVAMFLLMISTPVMTVLQNPEPIISGPRFISGLRLYDAFSMISSILAAVLPFWIGLRYLNDREGHRLLLKGFVFGAMAYSLPGLFEVRMSPQLHNWFYGFFPHDFIQHIRAGGFRPVVFLNHGLMFGMFFCMALISSLVLWREALREGRTATGWLFAAIWLLTVLAVSKNLGALTIAAILSLLVIFTGRRLQSTVALVIAAVIVLYPMLRGAGFVPVEKVFEIAASFDVERAASLKFRLDNEDALLDHANAKPLFGWGSWGRNQLYDEETGRMESVTDGTWIILIGTYGWLGYIAHFGLLTLPIMFYAVGRSRFGPSLITPGLILVLSATLIDLIPNAGLVGYVWLMAGGLAGYVLWKPINTTLDTTVTASADVANRDSFGFGGSSGRASWVMSATGPAPRRPRTARRERPE